MYFTSGEREKRKDQLLDLQKSKQERTDSELQNLRQVCNLVFPKVFHTKADRKSSNLSCIRITLSILPSFLHFLKAKL